MLLFIDYEKEHKYQVPHNHWVFLVTPLHSGSLSSLTLSGRCGPLFRRPHVCVHMPRESNTVIPTTSRSVPELMGQQVVADRLDKGMGIGLGMSQAPCYLTQFLSQF